MPYLYCRIACPVGLNTDQMEEGEQYSEYSVERNPRAYRSMRDYRNMWMSAPLCSVPLTYAPPPQPPQPISPVDQAILYLTKLVGDVVEGQKKLNS